MSSWPRGSKHQVSALALTFDDGPDPEWTPRLLDVLARAGAQATFFPIAARAAQFPELVARILAEGHAVGLHCDEHVRHCVRTERWLRADTRRALRRLHELGVRPTRWRTPWGAVAPWTPRVAREHGLKITGWTVDTHDWRGDSAAEMFTATRPQLRAGAIVLAHDGIGPGAARADAAHTVEYARLAAIHAAEHGLVLTSLS